MADAAAPQPMTTPPHAITSACAMPGTGTALPKTWTQGTRPSLGTHRPPRPLGRFCARYGISGRDDVPRRRVSAAAGR